MSDEKNEGEGEASCAVGGDQELGLLPPLLVVGKGVLNVARLQKTILSNLVRREDIPQLQAQLYLLPILNRLSSLIDLLS